MSTREQAFGEEVANAASHGLGFLLALASLPVLAAADTPLYRRADAGVIVFVATMLLVYLVSALYHALPDGAAKSRLRRVDHAAIFVFIAGTWTPFALRSGVEWPIFALVWGIALAGAALKLLDRLQHRVASTVLYVSFGWLALASVGPLDAPVMRGVFDMGARRRPGLLDRHGVLPVRRPAALRPPGVASVRAVGQRLPLRGGARAIEPLTAGPAAAGCMAQGRAAWCTVVTRPRGWRSRGW